LRAGLPDFGGLVLEQLPETVAPVFMFPGHDARRPDRFPQATETSVVFFRDLTVNRLRRDAFRSVPELVAAIEDYVGHHNANPKPFIWTAKANDILEKVKRGRAALDKLQSA